MATKSKKTAVKKTSAKAKPKSKAAAVKSKSAGISKVILATIDNTGGRSGRTAGKVTSVSHDPRVIEYKLFTEDSVRNLEDQVNYHIKKGWAPVGGVVLHGQSTFTQTMVRHEA